MSVRSLVQPLAVACTLLAAGAGVQAQTVLAVSSWLSPTHVLSETQKEWCAELEKKAAGKVKCNILPRAVSAPPGTFDAVRNGLADLSFTVQGYTPGRFVTTQMAEVPFLGNSSEAVSVAFQRMYDKYPAIAAEHQGVKVLAVFTHGPGIVFNTKRPIAKAEDLSGLKFRVGGGMVNEITQGAGHERHAQARAGELRAAVHRRDGRHAVPGRIGRVVQDRQGHQVRHQLPRRPVQHRLRLHDEPGHVRQAAGRREEGRRRDVGRVSPRACSAAAGTRSTAAAWPSCRPPACSSPRPIRPSSRRCRTRPAPVEDSWANAAEAKGLKDAKKVLAEFRAEIKKLEK